MSNEPVYKSLSTPAVMEQLAEECTELGKAALKAARIMRGENPTPMLLEDALENLVEESADVHVCLVVLGQQGYWYPAEGTEARKMQRWEERLHELESTKQKRKESSTKKSRLHSFWGTVKNICLKP